MTFSDEYITHLNVLQNTGMTSIQPVSFKGQDIIHLNFLKVLPSPSDLSHNYKGKTCIGCYITGIKNNQPVSKFIYNICDHEQCHHEVQAQAVSYTTGVPAMIGAEMIVSKQWTGSGVFNIEQFDPDPFMEALTNHGLPWTVSDGNELSLA